MKFPYQKVPIIGQQSIALPLINILLGEEKISTVCLIDSGATYSFFHANLGEILGLNIKKGIEIVAGGVTGAGFIKLFLSSSAGMSVLLTLRFLMN